MYMDFLCECNSITCKKKIRLSVEEMEKLKIKMDCVIIVEGCEHGPEPTDILVEEKTDYSIYREK